MLAFVERELRNGTMNIDCYSSAKTVLGAIHDLGRYVARNVDKGEGDCLRNMTKEDLELGALDIENIVGEYYLEVEEVSCASRYNEDTDSVEYKDGYNYYVYLRYVA